jgi:hypothetical protein
MLRVFPRLPYTYGSFRVSLAATQTGICPSTYPSRVSNSYFNLKESCTEKLNKTPVVCCQDTVTGMPKEITNIEEFQKLSEKASECKIKKLGDITKLKLRTPRNLYTIKLETKVADELLTKLTCPKNEI